LLSPTEESWLHFHRECTTEEARALRKIINVDFVDFEGEADPFGHSYFSTNPAVSSDLILLLRYGRAPGAENGRPLTYFGANFWRIEEDYPIFGH